MADYCRKDCIAPAGLTWSTAAFFEAHAKIMTSTTWPSIPQQVNVTDAAGGC